MSLHVHKCSCSLHVPVRVLGAETVRVTGVTVSPGRSNSSLGLVLICRGARGARGHGCSVGPVISISAFQIDRDRHPPRLHERQGSSFTDLCSRRLSGARSFPRDGAPWSRRGLTSAGMYLGWMRSLTHLITRHFI